MSNIYIKTILDNNPAFGYVAEDNLTTTEKSKIFMGLLGKPNITAPTRHKYARELAYKLSKIPTPSGFESNYRKRGNRIPSKLNAKVWLQESHAPSSTKTAAFMGSIIAHKLRIQTGNNGFAQIAQDLYDDGVNKRGPYKWALDRSSRQKAAQDAYERIAKAAKGIGYFTVEPKTTPKGSEERVVQGIITLFANKSDAKEMDFVDKMKKELVHSPTEFLNVAEAGRMYKKYGVNHIMGEFFDSPQIKKLLLAMGLIVVVGVGGYVVIKMAL